MQEQQALEWFDAFQDKKNQLTAELSKVIVGQERIIQQVLISIFCKGHCLLVGVPGLAKTLLVQTLSQTLGMQFNRIQFTPDVMPADITGSEIFNEQRQFEFIKGPLFAQVVLADEINRTPPKTQSALLEAMQERQVSAGGKVHRLPDPFFVLATQNPLEMEGTYPLPEAQLDRFLFKLTVAYPTADQEHEVLRRHDRGLDPHDLAASGIRAVANAGDLARARQLVDAVRVEDPVGLAEWLFTGQAGWSPYPPL